MYAFNLNIRKHQVVQTWTEKLSRINGRALLLLWYTTIASAFQQPQYISSHPSPQLLSPIISRNYITHQYEHAYNGAIIPYESLLFRPNGALQRQASKLHMGKPKRGSIVDTYQTVSVNCSKCQTRLFRCKY